MNSGGFSYDGSRVLTCDMLTATKMVHHGFSVKKDGTGEGIFTSLNLGLFTDDAPETVQKNLSLFCGDLAVDPNRLHVLRQVHGSKLVTVSADNADEGELSGWPTRALPEADGLITDCPNVPLAVFYADCTPILLLDPVRRVIAAVHSGWRGTVQKIAQRAVLAMHRQFGSEAEHILVAMGPSIKQCHFEVGEEVYLEFMQHFGSVAERHSRKKGDTYYIDTDALNVRSLLQTGVLESHISVCPLCTYCEEELFFSYRRSGVTGRMCAVIELTTQEK